MESTTMKKAYINPEIEVIKMKTQQQMLAGSVGDPEDGPGAGDPGDAGGAEGHFDGFDW